MKLLSCRMRTATLSSRLILGLVGIIFLHTGCARTAKRQAGPHSEPSKVSVVINSGGPIVLTTSTSEFQILPSGYLLASLLKDGQKLSLDAPGEGTPAESDYLVQDGEEVHFTLDFGQAKITEAAGKLGPGKRLQIPAQPLGPSGTGLSRTLQIEVYDDFPNLLLSSVVYANTGTSEYHLDHIVEQQHRFSSQIVKEHPYDMWSYQGASYDWGQNDVVKLSQKFSQPNLMGAVTKGGYGGGIPVVAFQDPSRGDAAVTLASRPLSPSIA